MKNILSTSECARILRAMSDETRLRMLSSLFSGEKCGTEIAADLKLPQPQVAHHLGILRNADLVTTRRRGQRVYYRLHPVVRDSLRKGASKTINLGCCKISFQD